MELRARPGKGGDKPSDDSKSLVASTTESEPDPPATANGAVETDRQKTKTLMSTVAIPHTVCLLVETWKDGPDVRIFYDCLSWVLGVALIVQIFTAIFLILKDDLKKLTARFQFNYWPFRYKTLLSLLMFVSLLLNTFATALYHAGGRVDAGKTNKTAVEA